MQFCRSCGRETSAAARFCDACGTSTGEVQAAAVAGRTIDAVPSGGPLWYVTYATGQTGGPFTEDDIRGMIARQQLKVTDSVTAQGGMRWVPITQSPFARFVVNQASIDRLAASTCPRCGAAMAVVAHQSSMGRILIIVGIITTMFFIGIVLVIIGVIMLRKQTVRYQCPRCNYRT